VEKKMERVEEFTQMIAIDPLLMKVVKKAIETYPFNTAKIRALTIDNPFWTEDYYLGERRDSAGGYETICDEQGVPSLRKMKELYAEKIEYAKTLETELRVARDGEKFWRYSFFFQEEKLGKYHQRLNEYDAEFLQDAMECDAEEVPLNIIGVRAGSENHKTLKNNGETIRQMGISMKEEFQLRENVMEAIRGLNQMGHGKQLIK
tara:strand:+ start:274 stop:888 length:615 start_codon:yes stop_codon:yes gene_type:complete